MMTAHTNTVVMGFLEVANSEKKMATALTITISMTAVYICAATATKILFPLLYNTT